MIAIASSSAAQDAPVRVYLGACEDGSAHGPLLDLLSTEMATSGYALVRPEDSAEWTLLVSTPCGAARAEIRVLDASGRTRAEAQVPLAGAAMPERTIAIWATELLRAARASAPERDPAAVAEQLRAQLTDVIAGARAARAADEDARRELDRRIAALEERTAAERARRADAPRTLHAAASSGAQSSVAVASFGSATALVGGLAVQVSVDPSWTIVVGVTARYARQPADLGEIHLLALGATIAAVHWTRVSELVVWGLGPSVEGGVSVGWGEPARAGVREQTVWSGHATLGALTELVCEIGALRIGARAGGGVLLGGVEAIEGTSAQPSLRGLFVDLAAVVGGRW